MREGDLTAERTVVARDGQVTGQGLLTVIWFADGVLAASSPNPLVGVG